MRLAIADPPYPPKRAMRRDRPGGPLRMTTRSRAQRWYNDHGVRARGDRQADHHPDAREWDDPARHRALLEQLHDEFDGWAIATAPDGLEAYAPIPVNARTMVWFRPNAIPGGHRLRSMWEPVIIHVPEGRWNRLGGQVPDLLEARVPENGFPGEKPPAWTRWVLDALGYDPDTDTVTDLFPGSGAITNAILQDVLI